MNNYEFQIWINYEYDKNLYRHNIISYLYDVTIKNIEDLGIKIVEKNIFLKEFTNFIYYHSCKKCKLIIPYFDDTRKNFNDLYENNIIDLISNLKKYLDANAFDLLKSKVTEPNFLELIYNNIYFELDDISEEDDDENIEDFICE